MKKLFLAAVVAALSVQAPAQAAILIFDDQASFLAAVSNVGTDSFNDLVRGGGFAGPVNRNAGTHAYTASAPGGFTPGSNLGNVFLASTNAGSTMTFSGFGSDIYAVGGLFFGSNAAGDYQASRSITVSVAEPNDELTVFLKNPNPGSFLGFVSTVGLNSLTVTVASTDIRPSIDNLILAGAPGVVPEPGVWAMMIVGFGLAGSVLRRVRGGRAFA